MAAKDLRAFLRSGPGESTARASGSSGVERSKPASQDVVLRSPSGFACGQCHSEFRAFADASECLQQCTVRLRLGKSVHVLASHGGDVFRCSLCARVRVHREDALRCFERCHHLLTHERGVPSKVLDALKPLRPTHSPDGRGLVVEDRPSLCRGPLFRGGPGKSPDAKGGGHSTAEAGYSLGTNGAPRDASVLDTTFGGTTHRSSHEATAARSHAQIDAAAAERLMGSPFGGGGRSRDGKRDQATRSTALTSEEVERRTRELLEGDLPEGATVHDADGFGLDAESPAGHTSVDMNADLGLARLGNGAPGVSADAHAAEEASDLEALSAAEPDAPAAPAELKRRADGSIIMRKPHQKSFKRADARYLCGACEARFFTKNEAEICFMAHPLDDMV